MQRSVTPRLGLDLRGGLQVLLEADLPANTAIDADALSVARTIIENRTNALGVSENVIQVAGDRRIVGEFPGLEDSEAVLAILQRTGLLEFVNMSNTPLQAGTVIETNFGLAGTEGTSTPTATPQATAVPSGTAAPATPPEAANQPETPPAPIYPTVMTGSELKTIEVGVDEFRN
ncbi:MAG: hypothetical protein Q7T47_04125, partial [Anaerolineales bacterium]|nr:hypothetical protein [Anaerolineales bacterium]